MGKGSAVFEKDGGIIMIASIIIWFLGYYPNHDAYESCRAAGKFLYRPVGTWYRASYKTTGFDWKLGIGLLSGVWERKNW